MLSKNNAKKPKLDAVIKAAEPLTDVFKKKDGGFTFPNSLDKDQKAKLQQALLARLKTRLKGHLVTQTMAPKGYLDTPLKDLFGSDDIPYSVFANLILAY